MKQLFQNCSGIKNSGILLILRKKQHIKHVSLGGLFADITKNVCLFHYNHHKSKYLYLFETILLSYFLFTYQNHYRHKLSLFGQIEQKIKRILTTTTKKIKKTCFELIYIVHNNIVYVKVFDFKLVVD